MTPASNNRGPAAATAELREDAATAQPVLISNSTGSIGTESSARVGERNPAARLTTVPAAEVVSVRAGRTAREVTVRCPYCWELHRHLWPHGADVVGTRIAHCSTPSPRRTYWVPVPAPEATR